MQLKIPVLVLIGLFIAAPVFAAEKVVTLSVPAMYCASCPFVVEAAMGAVEGVQSVKADIETRTALVVYDDEIATIEEIQFAALNAGYEALPIDVDS